MSTSQNKNDDLRGLPINQWAAEDRPREKMILNGKKSLTNSELIAILLRTGIQGCSAIDLAKELMRRNGHQLTSLARMEVNDLKSIGGLGEAKAVSILAALELGNRMLREQNDTNSVVKGSEDIFRHIAPDIMDLPTEEFWAIYINQRNKIAWKQRIGAGGLDQTSVDLRLIFKGALDHNAIALVVAHNHPSGSLNPSQMDKDLTHRLVEASRIMRIKLLDHLIIGIQPSGQPNYFSFFEQGLL